MDTSAKHILLIEDDETLGSTLMRKLIESGYAATWEKNGQDGLRRFKLLQPDLLLLDLTLPGLRGEEILEVAEKDVDLSRIPVVIISNSGQVSDIERLTKHPGVKAYLVKADFHPTEIITQIHAVLAPDEGRTVQTQRHAIMIVEDDDILSSLAVKKFQTAGYETTHAPDGRECLRLLEGGLIPDLILLDVIMPGMNGFDVLREIRKHPRLKHMQVVIFSNYAQDQDIETARALGAIDFLVKSKMTLKEVVDRVGEILGK